MDIMNPIIEKNNKSVGRTVERRVARCPRGEHCEVAERQNVLMQELEEFRSEFCELKDSVGEVVELLKDFKTVLSFFKGAGALIRWVSITVIAVAGVWAAITHWGK